MLEAVKELINTSGTSFEQGVLAKIMPAGTMRPARRGTASALVAYSTMPWLHAIANKVGNSISMVQWELYRVGKADEKPKFHRKLFTAKSTHRKRMMVDLQKAGELKEIETHPFLDLLDFGSDQFNGIQLIKLTQIYLDTVGECFWLKQRDAKGMPIGLWPIPPHWVIDFPTLQNPWYKIQFRNFTGEIPVTEMVYFGHPDPLNPYDRGVGTAKALADELETDEFAAQFTRSFFQNRARPDIIISGKGLSKEETRRLEVAWLQKHQGFFKAFKPAFISAEIDVKELGGNMKQTATKELREFERDTILQVYGAPPELFGVIENSNRATIDAADFLFAKHLMVPRLELIRSVLQEQLIPDFDERIILDYETPVEEDKEYHLNAAKAAPWALTIDEWREMMCREELPDGAGKMHMVPFNMAPMKRIEEMPEPEPAPTPAPAMDPDKRIKYRTKIITPAEAITVSEAVDDPLVILSAENMVRSLNELLFDVLGTEFIEEMGLTLALQRTARVSQFIHTQSTDRMKLMSDFTKSEVRRILEEGIAAGDTGDALAITLANAFEDWSVVRANRAARTESTRITGFSALESLRQAGIEMKEWITTMDGHERDSVEASHHAMDGQVVASSERFRDPVAGHTTDYPGNFGIPAEDINCRCAITARFPGQEDRSQSVRGVLWKNNESRRVRAEKRLAEVYRKVFNMQKDAVLKRLRDADAA